jgi:hypothetical protein
MSDSMMAIGYVVVEKRDKQTGEVTYHETFKNQITNYALTQVAAMWAGQKVNTPTMISLGTGSPPNGQIGTTPNDTGLWNEFSGSRQQVDYATVWLSYYTQFSATYQANQILGTYDATNNPTSQISLTEAGLWDGYGNLWSHVQLSGVTHDSNSILSIQWQVLQQGN